MIKNSNKIGKHILIADDEQEVVEQIRYALIANLNCVVEVAYNGKEALDKLRAPLEGYSLTGRVAEPASPARFARALERRAGGHCDLLILDILLPKLNGIEVCEFMIQDDKLKQIPTLLISILPLNSDDFQKSLIKFKEFAVVRDVLEKPFSDEDLIKKVKKIVSDYQD